MDLRAVLIYALQTLSVNSSHLYESQRNRLCNQINKKYNLSAWSLKKAFSFHYESTGFWNDLSEISFNVKQLSGMRQGAKTRPNAYNLSCYVCMKNNLT